MAKTTQEAMDKAIALFRAGKSLRECEKATGVGNVQIGREAKKRGITKGELSQLIIDTARVEAEFVALPQQMQQVVQQEVEKRKRALKIDDYLDGVVGAAAQRMMAIVKDPESTASDINSIMNAQNAGRVGIGTQEKFSKAPVAAVQVNQGDNVITFKRLNA